MSKNILLVVPSYNDSLRLGIFLPQLCRIVSSANLGIRIQVVDDGSVEYELSKTRELVEVCGKEFSELSPLISLGVNHGKGGAVYAGWAEAANEEWLAFVDADGAIPAEEVIRFCNHLISNPELDGLLASRVLMLGHHIDRTLKRHIIGRVYATLASILLGVPVYDSQCGLKIFRRSCFEQVSQNLNTLRFGFDMELITNFFLKGFRIQEMPITRWRDVPGAKVRLVKDSLNMFCSLISLRRKIGIEGRAVCRKNSLWV